MKTRKVIFAFLIVVLSRVAYILLFGQWEFVNSVFIEDNLGCEVYLRKPKISSFFVAGIGDGSGGPARVKILCEGKKIAEYKVLMSSYAYGISYTNGMLEARSGFFHMSRDQILSKLKKGEGPGRTL